MHLCDSGIPYQYQIPTYLFDVMQDRIRERRRRMCWSSRAMTRPRSEWREGLSRCMWMLQVWSSVVFLFYMLNQAIKHTSIHTCNIQVCKKHVVSWNYENYCRFFEKMSFCKKKSFELCDFEWILRPGHLNFFKKIPWNLICPSGMSNQLSQLEENRICARWHVHSAQIDRGLQLKANKTNNWVWVCLWHMSFSSPWDMCRMMTTFSCSAYMHSLPTNISHRLELLKVNANSNTYLMLSVICWHLIIFTSEMTMC